jgi:hypothetical protein
MHETTGHIDLQRPAGSADPLGSGRGGNLPAALRALTLEQRGVVNREQLLAAGVTPGELRWRLGRTWRVILPGVVLLEAGLPSIDQRLIGSLLFAGPASWLAGPTAAALHGVRGVPPLGASQRVYVQVPAPLRPRDVMWLSIRRTHLLDERLMDRGALRYSSRARAVVDAAAAAPSEADTRAIIIGAVQQGLVRGEDLAHWIEVRQTRGRRRLRSALDEAMSGVWSLAEGDLVTLLRSSPVLPEPMANPLLKDRHGKRLTTPDVWFDDVGLAVMVHSREFHEGPFQWEQTVESDSDLSALRIPVVGVTPASISRRPRRVMDRVENAYREALSNGFRPDVTATPRGLIRPAG